MVTITSFRHALRGLKYVMSSERNARIHLSLAVLALCASIVLRIGLEEWLFVIISITLVFFAEIANTAIEKTLDIVSPENNYQVKIIKDMCAAGVLVTAFSAVLVALVVFVPRVIILVQGLIK